MFSLRLWCINAFWDREISLNIACGVCISEILGTCITARHNFSHSQVLWEDEDDTLGHTLVAEEGPSVVRTKSQHYSNVMSLTGPPHQWALLYHL